MLVLQNAGPQGAPGMPESGYLPIPRKLARQGVKDMVRISDARMSGTAFGTIVLHVSPESAIGGPLALVRTGDRIKLDTAARRIDLLVDEAELEDRNGNVIKRFDFSVNRKEVVSEVTAYTMCKMMQGTVDKGTARGMRTRVGAAEMGGKTGTTDDNADAWFIGYTPQLLAGSWVCF